MPRGQRIHKLPPDDVTSSGIAYSRGYDFFWGQRPCKRGHYLRTQHGGCLICAVTNPDTPISKRRIEADEAYRARCARRDV